MKAEITQIKIKLNDTVIELTVKEARELQRELNQLLGVERTDFQNFKELMEKKMEKHGIEQRPPVWPFYPPPAIPCSTGPQREVVPGPTCLPDGTTGDPLPSPGTSICEVR